MVCEEQQGRRSTRGPGGGTGAVAESSFPHRSVMPWIRSRLEAGDAGEASAAAKRVEPFLTVRRLVTRPDLSSAAGDVVTLAEAHLLAGGMRESMPMSQLALIVARQAGDPEVLAQAAGLRVVATTVNGEIEDARWWRSYSDEETGPDDGSDAGARGGRWGLLLADAFLAFTGGDDAGLAALQRQAAVSERRRPDVGWILPWIGGFIGVLRADLAKDPRALLETCRGFRQQRRRSGCPPLLSGLALNREARSLVQLGSPGRALEIERDLPDHLGDAVCFVTDRATAHLASGRPEVALELSESCLREGTRHALYQLGPIRLRRAVALERLGRPVAASREFSLAWHLILELAVVPIMGIRAEDMAELFSRLRRSEPAFYDRLVSDPRAPIEVAAATGPGADLSVLTERELVVAGHLVTGATLARIADLMTVSRNTVKSQVRGIYRKLGVRTRPEAIAMLRRLGLRPPAPAASGRSSGSGL